MEFTNIHEHKRYYYTFDNSFRYYLLRAFRTLHKSFHAKIITSGFFRVSTGALA